MSAQHSEIDREREQREMKIQRKFSSDNYPDWQSKGGYCSVVPAVDLLCRRAPGKEDILET